VFESFAHVPAYPLVFPIFWGAFAVFLLAFVVLNATLSVLIVRPVIRMSGVADQVSTGNFEVPEFVATKKDEIAVLATSFNRLRRSLQHAMKLLE